MPETAIEKFAKTIAEKWAERCQVCQARVKKDSKSKTGLSCPKCGREYFEGRPSLSTDKDGVVLGLNWDPSQAVASPEPEPNPEQPEEVANASASAD